MQKPIQEPQVSTRYLDDITGKKPVINFEELLLGGLINLLPEKVREYKLELDKELDNGVHEYLCHLDKVPSNQNCDLSKGISKREKDRDIGYVQFNNQSPLLLFYRNNNVVITSANRNRKQKPIRLPKPKFVGNGVNRNNLDATVLGQGINALESAGTLELRTIDDNSRRDDSNFERAVNGEDRQSVGNRAILFNADGSVTRTANSIRDNAIPIERSANIPAEVVNSGTVPKKVRKAPSYKTRNFPKGKLSNVGATNDLAGGLAALGGMAALMGLMAVLIPMQFVTGTITFLTSLTTMITNVNNMANTFLAITDSSLALFGIKNSSNTIKGFLNSALDNVFGKGNTQAAKNEFAKCVNAIATTTKLLENVSSMRNSTDNKVDGIALQLGTVNNALGEAGLIPPELMATSNAIDNLVDTRAKDSPELLENLNKITSEIKTQDESEKEAKEQKEREDKRAAKEQKDLQDVLNLLDPVKTDLSGINLNDL